MIFENTNSWINYFKRHDERLLVRICEILPDCIETLHDNPHEDEITVNLVNRLRSDTEIRRLFHHCQYQFEPLGYDENGIAYSKGKIDFAFFWDQDQEKYLAYEAKRLNIKTTTGTTLSLATAYVTEGLVRFVSEQYSEGLPVGCMLGYVMDGNTKTARAKIIKSITENNQLVGLIAGPSALPAIASAIRMTSDHQRRKSGEKINIRHALVPCS